MKNVEERKGFCSWFLGLRKLIILDHPNPKGNKDDQFAPFRDGVNELIGHILFSFTFYIVCLVLFIPRVPGVPFLSSSNPQFLSNSELLFQI